MSYRIIQEFIALGYNMSLWIYGVSPNCQALVPNPSPPRPQSHQAQSQPSPTQFKTQIDPKGTGADNKIL